MQIRPTTPNSVASSQTAASPTGSAPDGQLTLSLSSDPETEQVLITVTPPSKPPAGLEKNPGRRAPLDICCVIDVSGSMSSEASIPADPASGKPAESNGLSVLDVVKHALRTIVSTMQDGACVIRYYQPLSNITQMTRSLSSPSVTMQRCVALHFSLSPLKRPCRPCLNSERWTNPGKPQSTASSRVSIPKA